MYRFQLSEGEKKNAKSDTFYTSELALDKRVRLYNTLIFVRYLAHPATFFQVIFAEQQVLQDLVPKFYVVPQDPLFEKQWNLVI